MNDTPVVMVVEDDAIIALQLQNSLTRMGYNVCNLVSSGEEAITQASALKPDIVLMDIRLRGDMTGIEAAEEIRKTLSIPIIYLTAYTDESLIDQSKDTGPYGYLVKPVREKELRASIEIAIYKSKTDRKLKHLNEVLRAIRDINQLMTKERNPDRLLQQICHIFVRTRGFLLVWIGRKSGQDRIIPIASAGPEIGYLKKINITCDGSKKSMSPAGRAFLTESACLSSDIETDPDFAPWREDALSHGLRACVAVPIIYSEKLYGVLTVYAEKRNAFDDDEIGFIEELASDIAYALRAIEEEERRKAAEASMSQSEEKYHSIFKNAVEGIFQSTTDGRFITVNPSMACMFGYKSPDEMVTEVRNVEEQHYVDPSTRSIFRDIMKNGGVVNNYELEIARANNERAWISINARAVLANDGMIGYYEGTVEDITKRKLAETELLQSYVRLKEAMEGIVSIIAAVIELRDPYTAGHQRRVAKLSRAIGQEMKLSEERIEAIYMAGILHDIGKISIPSEILSMPRRLSEPEFNLIKTHSQHAYDILKGIEFPWPIAEIVYAHHEKLDGSGYPRGLKGEEISIESRILCIADVVEAIASHRPYRPAFGIDIALKEITDNKDRYYDGNAADVCKLVFEKGFTFD
jgi:PAS domain S-box-containing protein